LELHGAEGRKVVSTNVDNFNFISDKMHFTRPTNWYVLKVRNLEAQNRHLADELDKLTSKWGRETTQIKAMYQAELDDARHALDEAEKEKARLEIRVSTAEDLIEEVQAK